MSSNDPPPAPRGGRLALVGLMGAGKTTTARALSRRTGWPVHDSDAEIEARTGSTGAELSATEGVGALHRLEEEVLVETLEADGPAIVTAAGSVVESATARRLLTTGATVVWLDVPTDEMVRRMATGSHRRSLDRDAAAALRSTRERLLAEVADLRLDATRPTDDLVDEILAHLSSGRGGSTAS